MTCGAGEPCTGKGEIRMGLDMYAFRIKKVTEEEAQLCQGLSSKEITKNGFTLFYDQSEDTLALITEILPYLKPVQYHYEAMDLQKVKKEYGVPEDALQTGAAYEPAGITYHFCTGTGEDYKSFPVKISRDDVRRFVVTALERGYIARMGDCAYWRKNYDLADLISQQHDNPIQNCGYYVLSMEEQRLVERYCRESGDPVVFPACAEDEAIVYHEWY